jgi:alkylhydroperoxidase/carboxymuconolactone decarboxylase family protein YurZ
VVEGAVHSHTRKALNAGATADEIRQAVFLAIPTVGFPTMMAALTWVEDVINKET